MAKPFRRNKIAQRKLDGASPGENPMHTNGQDPSRVIRPHEMAMLQDVLNQLLREKTISPADIRAQTLAARVIELFRSGVRDPEALKLMVG
ncbi:hypothetical protein MZK49_22415 [Ensifer sesbaniae]|uniref:hypothetical protein n=1 Tax=Ensifer sesbaniae TaxID=1214071 RepID=UPI002000C14D|nr:hypothetical protein [Ensifer sesbaniae]